MPLLVSCPECKARLEVEDEYRDWKVRCPQCRHEFSARQSASDSAVPGPVASHRGNEEEDEGDGDEEERPRRRRRRRRYREDDDWVDPEEGARAIAGPAMWLEFFGWGSLVLSLLLCAALVIAGILVNNKPQRNRNQAEDNPIFWIVMGSCVAAFAVPYFGLIGFGARKMRNLSSHGWGIASAVLAVAALPLLGVCGAPVFGIGIWALVAMNREDVKAAFKQYRRTRYDREGESE